MIKILYYFSVIVVVGCSGIQSTQDRHKYAEVIASKGNLELEKKVAGDFLLTTYHKGLEFNNKNLVVYIEGDGSAWARKYRLSENPTPQNPLALKLAARDPAKSILYIARPCMYLEQKHLQKCPAEFWSSHRYSEEVVSSINQAIDWAIGISSTKSLTLVGYSGGGTVATLVAGRRNDVISLITVVSNLDHDFWADLHKFSPLTGSLNPLDYGNNLSVIEQIHFVGAKDKIVPKTVVESYLSKIPLKDKISINVIKGFDHSCCWEDVWSDLLIITNINQ